MSSSENFSSDPTPLTDRELSQLRRLFNDPFNYPPELWNWIKGRMEEDPPGITWESILGFAYGVRNTAFPAGSSVWTTGDQKISAQGATHADPTGGTWYLADGSAIPVGETALIAMLGANFPDGRGRTMVLKGTHADVNAVGKVETAALALANRRPAHKTSVTTQPTISTPTFTGSAVTSGVDSADHTHSGTTGGESNPHTHPGIQGVNPNPSTGGTGFTSGDRSDAVGTGNNDVGHTHSFTTGGRSANHTHQVTAAGTVSTPTASGGAYGVTGTAATDEPAFLVVGNLFYHS